MDSHPLSGGKDSVRWEPVRPDLTIGITGTLLSEGNQKAVLTVVDPGGTFFSHTDPYTHVFYLFEGTLEITVGSETVTLSAGEKISVQTGILHGYRNISQSPARLISFNISGK